MTLYDLHRFHVNKRRIEDLIKTISDIEDETLKIAETKDPTNEMTVRLAEHLREAISSLSLAQQTSDNIIDALNARVDKMIAKNQTEIKA